MELEREENERAYRARLVAMVLPTLLGILAISIGGKLKQVYSNDLIGTLVVVLGYAMGAFALLIGIMTYLNLGVKGFASSSRERQAAEEEKERVFAQLQDELIDLKGKMRRVLNDLEDNANKPLTDEDRQTIARQLREQIASETNAQVFAEFKEQAGKEIEASQKQRDVREILQISRSRLEHELAALGRRGNLNLGFGAITTIVGLAILGVSVYSETKCNADIWSFASHFVPRFTLVIFIEIFAYFFLSLYRTSLQEIKYFQNELTNVESKQVALIAALNIADQEAVNKVLTSLAETERNHILTKDQTTVELEKVRVDRASNSDMLKIFSEIFQKRSG